MQRTVYLNGQWLVEMDAKISIFDRGFLFADAIYEVVAVLNGKLLEFDGHMERLARSCRELALPMPQTRQQLHDIFIQLIDKNTLREGAVYLQLSRGNAGDRQFDFPSADLPPTLTLFTQAYSVVDSPQAHRGIHVVTCLDIRWRRRDIKTVGLLAACLAKNYARQLGADDAFLVEDGWVTEGSASNAYIVRSGGIITRPLSQDILHGITRQSLMVLAEENGIRIEERAFTPEEAQTADEVFISSATTFVWPVVRVNDVVIGDGSPGPLATRLREIYLRMACERTA
ncbi:D-amino-acid transaminase [Raoultella sp. WB_B2P2-3]|uniref:branched-chain-amino-acid transaminase n=1 Tax=Raoultella scottii TaxID=3040937 RepID=A0ABU8YZI6_9ENTR